MIWLWFDFKQSLETNLLLFRKEDSTLEAVILERTWKKEAGLSDAVAIANLSDPF